jgi:hypothetical protein
MKPKTVIIGRERQPAIDIRIEVVFKLPDIKSSIDMATSPRAMYMCSRRVNL